MTQPPPIPPPPPLGYAEPSTPRPRRRWLRWVVVPLVVLLMLFLLLKSGPRGPSREVSLSDFQNELVAGNYTAVTLDGDTIRGEYDSSNPRYDAAGRTIPFSRTRLPQGMGGNYNFVRWLLDNRTGADVRVENDNGLLVNILLPLIPWLLIFGFIWFFVFRTLRRSVQPGQGPQQLVISGPGRWVPDAPAMIPPPLSETR